MPKQRITYVDPATHGREMVVASSSVKKYLGL